MLQEVLKVLAFEFFSLRIMFCYRKASEVIDSLVKHAATTQGRFVLYYSTPKFLLKPLCKDQLGTIVSRFVKMYQSCYSFILLIYKLICFLFF